MINLRKLYKNIRERYYKSKRKPYLNDITYFFNQKDLTIIASNCFAGRIYQDLDLPYNTPTVGLYFMYPDFIKFLQNFDHYLKAPLVFVSQSKYELGNERIKKSKHYYPVALLDGKIEVHFLHYHSEEEAAEKWKRRCERVNLDNLIVIGSDQNLCSENDIRNFELLPFKKKVIFSSKNIETDSCLYISEFASLGQVGEPYRQGDVFYKYLVDYAKKYNW